MSTARRCRKSPRSLSGTSAHPTMVTLVNIMVLNGWLTSFSFHVNQAPHSWDIAISDSDLETPKVKVMGVVKGQGHTVGPMMTSSNGNIFRVTGPLCGEFTGPGEFPTQRPVTRSFDVYFDLRLNKRLSKQSWGWWFETLSRSLWRHRNAESY